MAKKFDPNKNPYVDDLLRLNSAPRSRFTDHERRVAANLLAGKLYDLDFSELGEFRRYSRRLELGGFIFRKNNKPVIAEVIFESEIQGMGARLAELEERLHSFRPDCHIIVLKVGRSGVSELYNGKWTWSEPWEAIAAQIQRSDSSEASPELISGSIRARSDEEVASAYFGSDGADRNGAGDGRNGGDRGRNGGGGGPRDGDGSGGDQDSGAGGVRELLEHPVLFTVDEETLNAILEQA